MNHEYYLQVDSHAGLRAYAEIVYACGGDGVECGDFGNREIWQSW